MDDTISRDAAIKAILNLTSCESVRELFEFTQNHELVNSWGGGISDAIDAVIRVPNADVAERKRGRWIPRSDVPNTYTCSNCYQVIYAMNRKYLAEFHAFCGKCGADMREGGAE